MVQRRRQQWRRRHQFRGGRPHMQRALPHIVGRQQQRRASSHERKGAIFGEGRHFQRRRQHQRRAPSLWAHNKPQSNLRGHFWSKPQIQGCGLIVTWIKHLSHGLKSNLRVQNDQEGAKSNTQIQWWRYNLDLDLILAIDLQGVGVFLNYIMGVSLPHLRTSLMLLLCC